MSEKSHRRKSKPQACDIDCRSSVYHPAAQRQHAFERFMANANVVTI